MGPVGDDFSRMDDEDIIEDAEIIEELTDEDMYEEDLGMVSPSESGHPVEEFDVFSEEKNPLATVTMAELYVSQGLIKRAFTIYRALADAEPNNVELKKRLYELKMAIDEDTASARYQLPTETQNMSESVTTVGTSFGAAAVPVGEDRVLETLGKWLDAIKRRR
jgi:hypothetical protein